MNHASKLVSGERRCTPVSAVRFLHGNARRALPEDSILHYGVAGAAFERACRTSFLHIEYAKKLTRCVALVAGGSRAEVTAKCYIPDQASLGMSRHGRT